MKCSETFSPENKVNETLNLLSKITCYLVTVSQRDQGHARLTPTLFVSGLTRYVYEAFWTPVCLFG